MFELFAHARVSADQRGVPRALVPTLILFVFLEFYLAKMAPSGTLSV
jgi:hypothetical protein